MPVAIKGLAAVLLGGQLLGLLVDCVYVYHRLTLAIDFALFNQAYTEIGRGNLDPVSTTAGYTYVHSHFELIMWPLALVLSPLHTPFALLALQAGCLVGINLVTFAWIWNLLARRRLPERWADAIGVMALIALTLDPVIYQTAVLDFHFEATATLLALLTGWSVYRGRRKTAWICAAVCLLCGDTGGLYVAGVGLSAMLADRSTRRAGITLLVAGVAWIGLIGTLHANQGSSINQYAYLAGKKTLSAGFGGLVALVIGMLSDPSRPVHTIVHRLGYITRYLLDGGLVGLVSPYGFGVPALVLLTSSLQQTILFISIPFQQVAVAPFVLVGTASLVSGVAERMHVHRRSEGSQPRHARSPRRMSLPRPGKPILALGSICAAVICLGGTAYFARTRLPGAVKYSAGETIIPADEAATLREALSRTPSDAEVIASLPISGRFASRRYLYLYDTPDVAIPVRAKDVVLVLDTAHTLQLASAAQDTAAVNYVRWTFGARPIAQGRFCMAVEWSPPAKQSAVVLP